MAFQYVDIELAVRTATRKSSFRAEFSSGFNVVQAPNTWGKSTLVQSLVYGLGLEGAFSTSHLSPLGEAMSSVIDLDEQREAVVESSVTLTIRNDAGEYMRTRRFAKSLDLKSELIQAWSAPTLEGLSAAPRKDHFIRQAGGATHELGFHKLLENFIGLSLPRIPGYNTDEVKLYLEILLPLFYIEQKYGWSGLAPRVPTHFRVRSPYRRAAEYALGLSTLERLKEKEQLSAKLAGYRSEYAKYEGELDALLAAQGWTLTGTLSDMTDESLLGNDFPFGIDGANGRKPAEVQIAEMRQRVLEIDQSPLRTAGAGTAEARRELAEAEGALERISGMRRVQREQLDTAKSESAVLHEREDELLRIRETLVDVRKLERLGSDIHSPSLGRAHCPTCEQSLDAPSVVTGMVMDVEANLALLDAEKTTLLRLLEGADQRVSHLEAALAVTSEALGDARLRVRALKDELSGPSNAPSVAQIQERLSLDGRIKSAETGLGRSYATLDELRRCSQEIVRVQERLKLLRGSPEDSADRKVLESFSSRFTKALQRFGLRSLPVKEVTIGSDSLLPEHNGFELSFDIQHGMSASDTIRAKWAHYIALTSAVEESLSGHGLGILIMDEPRQQEAEKDSVRALYQELAAVANLTQVIVASSADKAEMDGLLSGLDVNLIAATKPHMFASAEPL